jgi:hypothetical protein
MAAAAIRRGTLARCPPTLRLSRPRSASTIPRAPRAGCSLLTLTPAGPAMFMMLLSCSIVNVALTLRLRFALRLGPSPGW